MVTNQKAQKEVERLKANISFLPNLSITLCFFWWFGDCIWYILHIQWLRCFKLIR